MDESLAAQATKESDVRTARQSAIKPLNQRALEDPEPRLR
jgi:hypothetical protein